MKLHSNDKSNRVLITGSSGFVGTRLCESLVEGGWGVIAANRSADVRPVVPGVIHAKLDLHSAPEEWQRALSSIDCVAHLAAHVHQMRSTAGIDPRFHEVNVEGSRFVAEQAARAGVRRFVFLSSIKVNGDGGGVRPYRADDEPNPRDQYAVSKRDAEIVLRDVSVGSGMELAIIRPPLIYGPGVKGNFKRLLALARMGVPLPFQSIDNRRSLLGVWNLTDFVKLCMVHPAAAGATWLVSDGEDISTPQLFRKLAHLMGRPARQFRFPPIWLGRLSKLVGMRAEVARLCDSLQVDTNPARERLAWRPPIGLDDGLSRTVSSYLASR